MKVCLLYLQEMYDYLLALIKNCSIQILIYNSKVNIMKEVSKL